MADQDIAGLNVPFEESVRYDSNFIRTAVCEFRYPTLLELEENPPVKLQRLLRKRYPHYSRETGVGLGGAGVAPLGHRYQFESRSRDWTISLRTSAISLETSRYTEFEEFLDRVNELLASAKHLLDTDFFTRVGLRYINVVSIDDGELQGWINPALISALLTNELGVLSQFNTELRGFLSNGQYTLRHGFSPRPEPREPIRAYNLDFDYFAEGVEFDVVPALLTDFNKVNFSFFRWTLGEKAKNKLGSGKPK